MKKRNVSTWVLVVLFYIIFMPYQLEALTEEGDILHLEFDGANENIELNHEAVIKDGIASTTIPNPAEYQFARVMISAKNNPSLFQLDSANTKVKYRIKVTGHADAAVDYIAMRMKGDKDRQTFITLERDIELDKWYEGEFVINEMSASSGKEKFSADDPVTEIRADAKNSMKEDRPITIHVDYIHVYSAENGDEKDPEVMELENNLPHLVSEANPGEEIIIPNGRYEDFQSTLVGEGTDGAPVIIRPETPGGVIFTGNTNITLTGEHLKFQGFHFDQANPIGQQYLIGLSGLSHSQVTDNVFHASGPSDPFGGIIRIQDKSQSNRIHHNTFKRNVSMGIAVRVNDNNNMENQYNRIDHNYFTDIPDVSELYPGETNGLEAIQIGQGYGTEQVKVYTTVDHNLFENITGDGAEIISSKTAHNEYTYNTFKNSDSGFTLRFGSNNKVSHNIFFNTKYGIRVTDRNQTIKENYMYGVGQGIRILAGRYDSEAEVGRRYNYIPVENATISDNVIMYPDSQGIVIGDGYSFNPTSNYQYFEPINSQITNNKIVLEQGDAIYEVTGENISYQNNTAELTGNDASTGNIDTGLISRKLKMVYNSEDKLYKSKKDKSLNLEPLSIMNVGPADKWWLALLEKKDLPDMEEDIINQDTVTSLIKQKKPIETTNKKPVKLKPKSLKNKDYIAFDIKEKKDSFPAWDSMKLTLFEKQDEEEWSIAIANTTENWKHVIIPLNEFHKSSFSNGNNVMNKQELRYLLLSANSNEKVEIKNVTAGQFYAESFVLDREKIELGIGASLPLSDLSGLVTYQGGDQAAVSADEISWELPDEQFVFIDKGILETREKTGTTSLSATYRDMVVNIPIQTVLKTIIDVTASDEPQPENSKENTIDGDLHTRWSAEGEQWIQYELRDRIAVNEVQIAFMNGAERATYIDIEVSSDGKSWEEVYSGSSSASTTQMESFKFEQKNARFVRIIGHGNTSNNWNSITEVNIPEIGTEGQ
ncbi:chondroitinase-B domain-containing protein [Gracilibacillus salinarum]|uniref:Discoidin domain-containing protein n=1 Tax=Gracilibacillus salinarum TaxID=2932255 RepID=A0ABY4GTB9_9BACI|nr:chondroitinase-B domain-containing protein [Gracilibacillus salinarum]UOQ86927.1 discoidin domain-containing protein [Gracilibacillus salinarum]